MENVVVLDGMTMIVFLILLVTICFIGAVSSLGWLFESERRKKTQERADNLADDRRIAELCEDFRKTDYTPYMNELEKRMAKERGICSGAAIAAKHLTSR